MFYEVPSWIHYLAIGDILVLVAYTLAFAFVESLLLFTFICLISLCLPVRVFKNKFIAQGSLFVGLICLSAVTVQRRLGWLVELQSWQIINYPLLFVVLLFGIAFLSAWIYDRFASLPKYINRIAERFTVFSYIYVPVSLLSLVVVILRNLV
jgi:hypothetical protein